MTLLVILQAQPSSNFLDDAHRGAQAIAAFITIVVILVIVVLVPKEKEAERTPQLDEPQQQEEADVPQPANEPAIQHTERPTFYPATKKHNQTTAVAELADVNWDYAKALSGDNPPKQLPRESPDEFSPFFYRVIVPIGLFLVWLYFVLNESQPDHFFFSLLLWGVIIIGLISMSHGKRIRKREEEKHRLPSTPKLYEMCAKISNFAIQYFNNPLVITVTYQIPTMFVQRWPILDELLATEVTRVIRKYVKQNYGIFNRTAEDEKKLLTKDFMTTLDTDALEYLLVPSFGRAVFESQVPVFRYRVDIVETPPQSDHDIEIGEII